MKTEDSASEPILALVAFLQALHRVNEAEYWRIRRIM